MYPLNAKMGLFEVTVSNETQLNKLEEVARKMMFDFWKQPGVGKPTRFTASIDKDNIKYIKFLLTELNLTMKIINENLDKTIHEEIKGNIVRRFKSLFRSFGGTNIHKYFASHMEYNQWLKLLKVQNPDIVTLKNIGKTYEGRDMIVIKLSSGPGKKAIFLDGGIHAREWLAISSVVWILNKLISGHRTRDSNVKDVLSKFDIYILPVTNPDGYEITRLGGQQRLWRKNAMPVGNGCKGIDLNRNFDVNFGVSGVSLYPCDINYPGKKPFNTIETRNFRDFVLSIKNKLKLFISFHSYSQMLLTPLGYTKTPLPDNKEIMRVANIMVDAIYKKSGVIYKAGSPGNLLYLTSGSSCDWVKVIGIKYSYIFEVRPDGLDDIGFLAPVEWIEPTGEELYEAVIAGAKSVK